MKIITDTGSLLSKQEADQLDVTLLPLQVAINGKNYRDYFELDSIDFIEMTKTAIPTSSQPAIGEVMEAYEDTQETLHITMAKGLSATYVSALGHIESQKIKHVTLFNSMTLSLTQRYLVRLASKLKSTHSIDEIINRMNTCLRQCQSYLIPEDFDYLKRGGRLSPLAATLGGFLKIKPIVTQVEGSEKLEKLGTGRNWKTALDKIIDKMKENGVDDTFKIFVSHAENHKVIELAKTMISIVFPTIEVEVEDLSPVMITQGGPGCIAIQYIKRDPAY